jgi:uncharacterized membrane protein HdeD (DUF308 family)
MYFNPEKFKIMISDFQKNRSLLVYSGMISTILGLIITRIHNFWVPSWPLLITLIGWLVLIKGLYRLFFLEKFVAKSKKWITEDSFKWICWGCIIIGAYLAVMGFTG